MFGRGKNIGSGIKIEGCHLFNHSFMIPGLIGVGTATLIGYLIGAFLLKI